MNTLSSNQEQDREAEPRFIGATTGGGRGGYGGAMGGGMGYGGGFAGGMGGGGRQIYVSNVCSMTPLPINV